jgi:hypothetical protein
MALMIQTTGLEDWAPGGKARVKVLVIGGPGVGKTRWASYFPQPIYADCEGGLASVADRRVPYVSVNTSQDMLDLLAYLKQEARQPTDQRQYNTIVIDTLDAFARKVKNEWLERERKSVFTGWEAWGFLNSRMSMLLTRLLNLDMNVIVNVHYKDKVTKDDETGRETHELMPQLQGETADNIFNDFDLVAWMGTYWEPVEGERLQKRGLTFKPTPDKPFLKDRLHVTPPWLEVEFAESDYTNLFDRITARLADIPQGEVVGQIESETPDTLSPANVVAPGAAGSGALPAQSPRGVPVNQLDKPTLIKRLRDAGVKTTVDGSPIKGNTTKAELVAALEAHLNAPQPATPAASTAPAGPAPAPTNPPAETAPTGGEPKEPAALPTESDAPQQALARVANAQRTQVDQTPERAAKTVTTEVGPVDPETGEVLEPATPEQTAQAIATVQKDLGGTVIEDKATPVPAKAEPAPASDPTQVCEECGKDLQDQKADFVKLAWIKYRKRLCEEHYLARKTAAR